MTSPADLPCDLPDDLSDLRAAALAMRAELEAERALRRGLEDQNERPRHFIRQLQRMQFGRRSEKFDPRPAEPGTRGPRTGGSRSRC